MNTRDLAAWLTLATITLGGCGANSTAQPQAFELDGSWLYLGPADGPHSLTIGNTSMAYADIAGTWSSHWTLQDYDNELHRFQVVFDSGTGTYLPIGEKMSGTYVLSGTILTVQLADGLGAYLPVQSPGSCTEGGNTLVPDCRIYVSQK